MHVHQYAPVGDGKQIIYAKQLKTTFGLHFQNVLRDQGQIENEQRQHLKT